MEHRCGVAAMVVEVLLGIDGFDVDRGAEMTGQYGHRHPKK